MAKDLWPADLHLIGKEIVRFHAVFWPAFLMAAGLPLPKRIFAHGWLLFENDKMSKSRGNIVRSEPIREVMGADALRYFLLREMVFGQDGSFSYDALIGRYNSDLANGLGNLASRTLTMIHQYRKGAIPPAADTPIADVARDTIAGRASSFDAFRVFQGTGSHLGADLGASTNSSWSGRRGSSREDRVRNRRNIARRYPVHRRRSPAHHHGAAYRRCSRNHARKSGRSSACRNRSTTFASQSSHWGGLRAGQQIGTGPASSRASN